LASDVQLAGAAADRGVELGTGSWPDRGWPAGRRGVGAFGGAARKVALPARARSWRVWGSCFWGGSPKMVVGAARYRSGMPRAAIWGGAFKKQQLRLGLPRRGGVLWVS